MFAFLTNVLEASFCNETKQRGPEKPSCFIQKEAVLGDSAGNDESTDSALDCIKSRRKVIVNQASSTLGFAVH